MNFSKLKDLNVCIATHVFTTGPSQELEEYLKRRVNTLMFIGHPFSFAEETGSFFRMYDNGKPIKERNGIALRLPEPILYIKDFVYTLLWVVGSRKTFDIFFGVDPLNSLAGIFLSKIGKTRKVIMYTIDYVPKRFGNKFLNWIYHQIDSYCVAHCHQIWNLSPRMADEREKKGIRKDAKQVVVPIGVNFGRINHLPFEEIDRNCIVYMGHLRKGQGLELIIRVLPEIIKRISTIKLLIIGTGPLENNMKELTKELGVSNSVEFKGLIKDHRNVEEMLSKCAVGLATYEPTPDSITQYTDPSKPKQYLACGLPVIITRVPWIAKEIEKKTMGVVIGYSEHELANAITMLLTDEELYQICRENAIRFASKLDWTVIFDEAFSKL